METLEQTVTTKPELISETKEGIIQLHQIAEGNRDLLNRITELSNLKTRAEILEATGNRQQFIRDAFFKLNPDAKRLSEISNIPFVYPPQLEELDRLLQRVNNHVFQFVELFGHKSKKWSVDVIALENECDRKYRRFAVSDIQRQRLAFARQYLAFVQTLGEFSRRQFLGPIVQNSMGKGLTINETFINEPFRF